MDRYILVDGVPTLETDLMRWAIWFENLAERIVGKTVVGDYEVSTVFLGLDHSFGGGVPILYETIIFGPDDAQSDMWRYATAEEAREGHERVVAALAERVAVPLLQ
jgi:hypothetical protein